MSAYLVDQYLPGITRKHLGAKATSASTTSERTCAAALITPRQHHAKNSLVGAWVMIGTILGCLAIMMAVVIATATSIS